MILDGKYIKIKKENVLKELVILYDIGYSWEMYKISDYQFALGLNYDQRDIFVTARGNILFLVNDIKRFSFQYKNIKETTTLKNILRENKLKRIMKSNNYL